MRFGVFVYDGTGNFFTGDIDEVAIFDKAIPADRIAQHYKAGKEGAFTVPFINDTTGGLDSFAIDPSAPGARPAWSAARMRNPT